MLQLAFIAIYSALLFWSAFEDIRSRTIPNAVIVALSILYVLYCVAGFASWTDGALGALLMFLPTFALFHFGFMGGGDTKLMTAIALWMGAKGVLAFCLITSIAGGILALVFLIKKRRQEAALQGTDQEASETPAIVLPYGVAIAAGGLAMIWIWQFARLGVL